MDRILDVKKFWYNLGYVNHNGQTDGQDFCVQFTTAGHIKLWINESIVKKFKRKFIGVPVSSGYWRWRTDDPVSFAGAFSIVSCFHRCRRCRRFFLLYLLFLASLLGPVGFLLQNRENVAIKYMEISLHVFEIRFAHWLAVSGWTLAKQGRRYRKVSKGAI